MKQITESEMRQALGLAPAKRARTKDAARPDMTLVSMSVRHDGGLPFAVSEVIPTAFRTEAIAEAKSRVSKSGLIFWCLLDVEKV